VCEDMVPKGNRDVSGVFSRDDDESWRSLWDT